MIKTKYFNFLIWRLKNINQTQLLIILSICVGIIAGLAAVALKTLVHYMEVIVTHSFAANRENYIYLTAPLVGILLTVIYVKYFVKDEIGHGISRILFAISRRKGNIKPHNMYSSIISCSITSGFGGSVGMEAPIVYTGSAIGSNLAKLFRLSHKSKMLLIGCGAAAAVSAIFKAPIAGVIFCLEILMLDLTTASIVPLLVASVSASVVSYFFLGQEVEFFSAIKDPFEFSNLLFYVPLGIFSGFISLYFTRMNFFIEAKFNKYKSSTYKRVIIGGILLGILIFIFPPLYGEGYLGMTSLLKGEAYSLFDNSFFYNYQDNQWLFILYLLLILLFKVFATSITTGSGGVGGVFAPALFMGAFTGFIYSRFINTITSRFGLSEHNFTLVGMAGLMAGIMHAPLTSIFLIAEITGSYGLFLPLMTTACASFLTIRFFEPHSIYTKKLAAHGDLLTHHKDKTVLTLLNLKELIETNFNTVHPKTPMREIVEVIKRSKRNIFPVIDNDEKFLGLIAMDDIRDIMFDIDLYDNTYAYDVMIQPPTWVTMNDTMETVMDKFNKSGLWNLPVIEEGKYLGFVSRSNIFAAYRKLMLEISED